MGTARMGRDPKTSVLNKWNQVHTSPNVFVTDGACMTSNGCVNPSLTYMALTARAAIPSKAYKRAQPPTTTLRIQTMPDDTPQFVIDRREAIRRVSDAGWRRLHWRHVAAGRAARSWRPRATPWCRRARGTGPTMFTAEEVAYLDEIAETILPATSTPGAKDAKTGRFIGVMVQDCYTKEDQAIFKAGMTTLNDACTKAHGHGFMQASPEERLSLLTQLDKDAKAYQDKKKGDPPTTTSA
jgi:hypothetical protein